MNAAVMGFVRRHISDKDIRGRRVLEVGSLDVNGSCREVIEGHGPREYIGCDLSAGKGVDMILDASKLVLQFGPESFDVVVSTEMLEHAEDWKTPVLQMKRVLKPGGVHLLTTRSPGFPYHGFPSDWWRFTQADMRRIYADMRIDAIESDNPGDPGVFVKATKPVPYNEITLDPISVYRMPGPSTSEEVRGNVPDQFHALFYNAAGSTWLNTRWLGIGIEKNPFDLWVYQEIIHELRPDLIIECGTKHGGSALYMASMLDLVGHGRLVTVDINKPSWPPAHNRITYITGSSVDSSIVAQIKSLVNGLKTVMVVLDSDHRKSHVLAELSAYSGFVTVGSYLIVEDGNINGHPVLPGYGPGPAEAIDEFIKEQHAFEIDYSKEKFLMTFNPRGYMKRVR